MPGKTKCRALEQILPAIKAGTVTVSTIDKRARAVLELLEKTGKFDDRSEEVVERAVDFPEHR